MRDRRRPPFCYQTLDATAAIRGAFEGKERNTALAIYQSLTEAANEHRDEGGRNGFKAARAELAKMAGVTDRTLDRYAREFEKLGLLAVERESTSYEGTLPNTWVLTEPEGGAKPNTGGGEANDTLVQEVPPTSQGQLLSNEQPVPRRKARVGRHEITGEEWTAATALLQKFNERAGTKFGALTSRRDPSPHTKQIIERLREYPDLDLDRLREIVDYAFDNPWWQEKKVAGVGVVFGPNAFPRCAQMERPGRKRRFADERDPSGDEF